MTSLKSTIFILALTLSLTANAQLLSRPLIQNLQDSVINKYTPTGLKTGLWVKYFYTNGGYRRIVNTGHYQDGKKVGTWRYFSNEGDLVCLDTSNCPSVTEIYAANGSVTILGADKTFINADSSLIRFTRQGLREVVCKKNRLGQYECIRKYESKTMKPSRKTFADFDDCFYHLDTKW